MVHRLCMQLKNCMEYVGESNRTNSLHTLWRKTIRPSLYMFDKIKVHVFLKTLKFLLELSLPSNCVGQCD